MAPQGYCERILGLDLHLPDRQLTSTRHFLGRHPLQGSDRWGGLSNLWAKLCFATLEPLPDLLFLPGFHSALLHAEVTRDVDPTLPTPPDSKVFVGTFHVGQDGLESLQPGTLDTLGSFYG